MFLLRLVKLLENGSVMALKEDDPVGLISSPWAVDATGKQVPTYFEVSDSGVLV